MAFTINATLTRPHVEAVAAARTLISEHGFGILTEIDLAATLEANLGVDDAPQVILGVRRPELAHKALRIDPSIGAVLPCNVVVRGVDDRRSMSKRSTPTPRKGLAGEAPREVAADARQRLTAVLEAPTDEGMRCNSTPIR